MRPLDPRKLETYRVVVKAGRISTAAKLLHLSQPAVTAQIKALEEECRRPLLFRTPQGVVPNEWGARLLVVAEQVHGLVDRAITSMRGASDTEGELVVGASMTTAAYVMPPLLAGFRHEYPAVALRVEVANTANVVEWVATGRVSLGIVEGLPRAPRVTLEPYLDDELVPVVAETARHLHALKSAEDLRAVPIIRREPGSGSRDVVDRAIAPFVGRRRPSSLDIQMGSNQSVKLAAIAGLGVAFLSRWSVQLEVAAGNLRILSLRGLTIKRAFAWALASTEVAGLEGTFLSWARRNPPALR